MQQSIVIIICYYGNWPWYFSFFLHSCGYNPTVHFIIVTDIYDDIILPPNVKIINMPLMDVKKRANKAFGFEVSVDFAYKLCDFKPAYGIIFNDLIEGYDFWGHGDIDVVFGNIREFMTDDVLLHHDLLCVRHDVLTGYFQLFRNTEKMNTLFMQSKDYKQVFSSPEHYCFDETNFAYKQFMDGVPWYQVESDIESMMHVVKRLEAEGIIRAYFDFHVMEGLPGRIKWQAGKLVYNSQYELMLFHLIQLKKIYKPKKAPRKIKNTFYISTSRIYT